MVHVHPRPLVLQLRRQQLSQKSLKEGTQFDFKAVSVHLQFSTTEKESATNREDGTVSERRRIIQPSLGFGFFIYKTVRMLVYLRSYRAGYLVPSWWNHLRRMEVWPC